MFTNRPEQAARLAALEAAAAQKMDELGQTIELRRAGKADAALALVRTDRGKILMDRIRAALSDMESAERQLIARRGQDWRTSAAVSLAVTLGGSAVLLILIAFSAMVASRDFRKRQLDSWLRSGQMGLSEQLQGDQTLEKLGSKLLAFLAAFLEAQVGAVYIAEGGHFRRFAGYALPAGAEAEILRPGDRLIGQAAKDNTVLRVRDVPPGYLPIASGVGHGTPGELLVVPASIDGMVHAVVELGFFGSVDPGKSEFLTRVRESIAVAVRASRDRHRLEDLLQETQQQAEELQTGQEELRVSNEELEEQGRALRESQAQLESQQAELEQINSRLEEQTQLLEHQKDALAKSHGVLAAKSAELQRANEYKSEFLANMSHELRTPLNSTLILAKLLADNKDGNLTELQVKYAQTITSSGNDLLGLINDVLDLSRIEAGKVDLAPETVSVTRVVESLTKMFQPAAEQKRLGFSAVGRTGRPRGNRNRSAATGANSQKPAVECREVHGKRRSGAESIFGGPGFGVLRRARHRSGRCASSTGGDIRGVSAGRRQHPSQIRRHRSGFVDLARPGGAAGGVHCRAQRTRRGQRIHVDGSRRVRRRRRRRTVPDDRAGRGVRGNGAAGTGARAEQPRPVRTAGGRQSPSDDG